MSTLASTPATQQPLEQTRPLDQMVHTALQQSPYLSRRHLRFETEQGRVTLKGTVGSYYQKQMAQELLRRVDGVQQIENHLVVDWS